MMGILDPAFYAGVIVSTLALTILYFGSFFRNSLNLAFLTENVSSEVDWPSLPMVLCFTSSMLLSFLDPTEIPVSREIGAGVLVCGFLIFAYVLRYLRGGLLGDTRPKLDYLITEGPYSFCRHSLYLSFIIMILGIDLMFRSVVGIILTFILAIPSAVYRARVEDGLLRNRFGEEWEKYSERVGFLFPKLRKLAEE